VSCKPSGLTNRIRRSRIAWRVEECEQALSAITASGRQRGRPGAGPGDSDAVERRYQLRIVTRLTCGEDDPHRQAPSVDLWGS
jgi:hypothetical protein